MMHGIFLHATVKTVVIIFTVLILISTTVTWHVLTPSESRFLWRLCIGSLSVFWKSVMISIIKRISLIRQFAQSDIHILLVRNQVHFVIRH